jgi:hypothetical protein
MLMMKERRPAIRSLRGWAIGVLQEVGAIRECEEHGCISLAHQDPPAGVPPGAAVAELSAVLDSVGDSCPECPSEADPAD